MAKKFNITGLCIPREHFMADIGEKLDRIMEMTENGSYFIINRPRQYGKTTVIYLLAQRLKKNKNYLMLDISFEGIDSPTYENHHRFIQTFLNMLKRELEFNGETELATLIQGAGAITDFDGLNVFLSQLVARAARNVVLMIDEVDKSSNNQLFLDFLGMLRTKYLDKKKGKGHTFHSVILAGVHDVKTLKSKIRPSEKRMYNSPWNIAVHFKVKLELFPGEIAPMLEDYARERQVEMDVPFFAEQLFYYTSGYPFLVSYLCKTIDEEIRPTGAAPKWHPGDLLKAIRMILLEDNANFTTLVKNLENHPDLYELVFKIIMNEQEFSYNLRNPVIDFGVIHGVLKEDHGKVRVHNRIYEQLIFDYMSSKLETSMGTGGGPTGHLSESYIEGGTTLNIEKIIRQFQRFMKEQYSRRDADFIERNGRLLFLAFIKPILNGRGFDFKEVQVSEEKRLDIVIIFENTKYIIELKIWRGESYHREGVLQLCDYLDRQNQDTGYLLIYDLRKESGCTGESQTIDQKGKRIFAAWV